MQTAVAACMRPDAYADVAGFAAALTALGPFGPAPHLAVALSGGADSLALALLAQEWAQAQGGHITTLTVDHQLRAESRAEAEHVAQQMQAQGIAHHILTPAHTTDSNNLQEAARSWRYDALADWCKTHSVLHCLVAHHAGDQRETVALHSARGATADGPSGMAAVRAYRGVRFLRPLLGIEKSTLIDYLQARDMMWVEDPSNRNEKFARVRTRNMLQDDAAQQNVLSARAYREGEARAARDDAFAQAAMQCITLSPAGFARIDHAAWSAFEPTLASQILADILTTISGATQRPRQHETQRLYDALQAQHFSKRTLLGCTITLENNIIQIAREYARVAAPVLLSGKGELLWDNRFHVKYDVPASTPLLLQALGKARDGLPASTPALWHLDQPVFTPHIAAVAQGLPSDGRVTIGFAPAKPLAAAPFWWLNQPSLT